MNVTSAYCGLYCDACPLYIDTQNGTATGETCEGCKSGKASTWCTVCNLKTCAKEKGHEFCGECSDYPCSQLETFKLDPEYPYHDDVYEHLDMISKVGEEAWREAMDKKYRDKDGNFIDWYKELEKRKMQK